MPDRLLGVAVAVPFVVGTVLGVGGGGREVAFHFEDPAITESSGLVVLDDGLVVTTNDSGDTGRVFTVDPATGETVGVTTWASEPEDVEALAPVRDESAVWVADIGDNGATRGSVSVWQVPVGRGDRSVEPTAYELVYPDGPRDAETLVADAAGRLYVASKGVLGGDLYAAPERLDPGRPNELARLGPILPIATDGAFTPDGSVLVLRDYGRLVSYAFPSLRELGEERLPKQQQGEGLAIGDSVAYVSSEGARAPVFSVSLPPVSDESEPDPRPESSPTESEGTREDRVLQQEDTSEPLVWPWIVSGGLGLGVIAVLLLALRRR